MAAPARREFPLRLVVIQLAGATGRTRIVRGPATPRANCDRWDAAMNTAEVPDIRDAIYEAAVAHEAWPVVLQRLGSAFRSASDRSLYDLGSGDACRDVISFSALASIRVQTLPEQ